MNKLYFFSLLSLTYIQVFATNPPNEALATSLGGSSVTYISPFSVEYNPANLTSTPSGISLNAQNRYGISQYSKVLFIGNYTMEKSAMGLSYQIENGIISNQKIAIAFAKKINQNLASGVTINFNRFSSQNTYYQNSNILTFTAGLH